MADLEKLCFGCMREKPDFSPECPYCKFDANAQNSENALPIKHILQNRYYIGRILNENGEGFTYLAYDILKQTPVRVREFFPFGLAERINTIVKPYSEFGFTFDKAKQEFSALARALAHMNSFEELLSILDIFEENGTAYYVTEYVEAITLRDFLLRNGGVLNYEQFRPLIMPLLSTISSLHAVDIIHRGISPDTILVGKDGKLRLTEFSIADTRTARTQFQAHLHKGYAAIEQYGFDGEQGPWTDVYALGALMYRILVGNPPPEATVRVTDDKMTIPAEVARVLPGSALSALANSLEILPSDRAKSVEEFKKDLTSESKLSTKYNSKTGELKAVSSKQYRNKLIAITIASTLAVILLVFGGMWLLTDNSNDDDIVDITTTTTAPQTTQNIGFESDEVPNFVGMLYSDILSSPEHIRTRAKFVFEISEAVVSSEPAGKILDQSPAEGTLVTKGQVIKIQISGGNEMTVVPNLTNMTKEEAIIELLKVGFLYENISFGEKYNTGILPECVVDVTPHQIGSTISKYSKITINMNTYVTTTTQTTTTLATKPTTTKKTTTTTKTAKTTVAETTE
ncbi:MAG: PASTA domain-containing protein [Clostridia bacterium]|nr:PASTA domain-containing protein [Clostridia bacterium]